MALTTEQVLILNNLMYMGDNRGSLSPVEAHNGETIGQWLNSIDVKEIQARPDTDYMTNQDWQNIIEAAKNDDTIMNMRIAGFNEDKGEGEATEEAHYSSAKILAMPSLLLQVRVQESGKITLLVET